jgi:uncharacterized surface protein with fasciclin (FAS1) repeats
MSNLFEALQASGSFPTFISGVEKAGLVETLKGPSPLTVFVPTEEAFTHVDQQKRATLFARGGEKLSRVMQYHIAPGYYMATDLLDHLFLKTLEGQRLVLDSIITPLPFQEKVTAGSDASRYVIEQQVTHTIQQSLKVNQATIVQANWRTDNGVIHTIDRVLFPLFLVV